MARSEEEDGREEPGAARRLLAAARERARPLEQGPALGLLGGAIPHRALVAAAIFVVVFLLAWVALWGLFGGAGLALGWMPATALGLVAVSVYAQRLGPDRSPPAPYARR